MVFNCEVKQVVDVRMDDDVDTDEEVINAAKMSVSKDIREANQEL